MTISSKIRPVFKLRVTSRFLQIQGLRLCLVQLRVKFYVKHKKNLVGEHFVAITFSFFLKLNLYL